MKVPRFAAVCVWLCSTGLAAIAQPRIGACPVLPAGNIWNTRIDQLPAAPVSSTYINTIGSAKTVHADFGSGLWNGAPIGIPYVTVSRTQTRYPASFTYAADSDPGPYAVPLNAPIEGGSQSNGDRHAIAVDVDNCILYELYSAYPGTAGWKAGSGAIFNLASDALRTATWTSADAAGLPILPGLIRYDEIAAGQIQHALRFTVPQTQRAYMWPARHYASSLTDPKYPPMGARFRLKAGVDISRFSPVNQIILRALQTYGMMLADNGSAWYLSGAPDPRWNDDDLHNLGKLAGADFEVVDVSALMVDPNSGQARQTAVTVTVSPAAAAVPVNATRQFTAAVQNSPDQSVFWAVNGVVGGNSATGWVDSAGLYTAPAAPPSPNTVTLQATSRSNAAAVGSAAITITVAQPVSVKISPSITTVRLNGTQQFTATVHNSPNTAVTWKVNGMTGGNATFGQISKTGLYTAPGSTPTRATVTIEAVSIADPNAAAAATVTLRRR